jgi:hypothetical protein
MANKLHALDAPSGDPTFQRLRDMGDGTHAIVVATASDVLGSDGVVLPVGTLAESYGYDTAGNLTTTSVTYLGNTYVQTLTWVNGQLMGTSAWVKQ